jgi:dipeptidyl aminopeptidase/acylaminoacyl peptidase
LKLLEQLFRVPYVNSDSGFDISPDSKKIAFSWNLNGSWEIFIVDAIGKSEPLKITDGPGGKFHPSWSPDGKTIAYVLDKNGSESYRIHLLRLEDREDVDLTSGLKYPLSPHYDWSPDGTKIVYLSIEDGFYGVNIKSISDGNIEHLCSFDTPLRDIVWSPDGNLLAIEEESAGTDSSIIFVSIDSKKKIPLSIDGKIINAQYPKWFLDGSKLLFSSDDSGFHNIGIYDSTLRNVEWQSDGSTEDIQPVWSPSYDQIAYVQNSGCKANLIINDLGVNSSSHDIGKGVFYSPKYLLGGAGVCVIYEDPCHPPDLWLFSLVDGSFSQLTYSMPEELKSYSFVMPDEITYTGLTGENIPALLYRPNKDLKDIEKDSPAIVNIHGGPDWLYQFIWNPFMSYLSSKGWTVLAPNYRGSIGYGHEWQIASRFKMGEVDTEDIIAGAEYLINEKLCHPSKIIVTGRSHGGYLTMMCLIKRSDLWAGGSAVVPFLNLFSSHEESRQDLQHWNIENYGDPVENHDRWVEGSPYYFLDRIQVPVQLICSENDVRCPASDAIASHKKLKELGLSSELIVIPDEGHELLKIENIVKSYKSQIRYFDGILKE